MFASVAVIGVSVLVGWLAKPLVGVAVFAVAVVLAAIAYLRAENPDRRTVCATQQKTPMPKAVRPVRGTYSWLPTKYSQAMSCTP